MTFNRTMRVARNLLTTSTARPAALCLACAALVGSTLVGCGNSTTLAPTETSGAGGADASAASSSTGTAGGGGGTGGESPHEALVPSPGGMRRLLPQQLVSSVDLILGAAAAATVVDIPMVEPLHGFASIGAAEVALTATDVGELERIAANAAQAAVDAPTRLIDLSPCVGDAEPEVACYADVARDVGRLAWRRPMQDDEIERLVAVAEAGNTWSSESEIGDPFDQGLKYELMAILQSPNFLYLVEIGTPDPEDATRRILGPYEMASRLSFFLQGRTPTSSLLDDAEAGKLDTPDGLREAARQLLADDRAKLALDAFYTELFYLDDLANLSKDAELYPDFDAELANSMRQETLFFMRDLVWDRNADAREMFTSRSSFVDADLADLYGVDPPDVGFERRDWPESQQRTGLFGQASFLARFAHPGVTSPTRRGHYINARFLCDEIPPPPAGVNTTLPNEDPGHPQTLRERLARHAADPECSGCHSVMDPVGLTLEHFDSIGAYREDDRGLELDVSGESEGLGSYSGPVELAQLIANDDRTPRCVVQNFLRSSLGHLEGGGERYAVRDLGDAFVADGYSIRDLMVELTASPLFRYVGDPK